jgi:hypothetical protein
MRKWDGRWGIISPYVKHWGPDGREHRFNSLGREVFFPAAATATGKR